MNQAKAQEIDHSNFSQEKETKTLDTPNQKTEEYIKEGEIKLVIAHTECSREEAIIALRQTKGNVVGAIMAIFVPEKQNVQPQTQNNEELLEDLIKEEDVQTAMAQTQCNREQAIQALRQNEGDLVNAIMDLTM